MSSPTTIDIARATSKDVPRLSRTLARAFDHDPVLSWVVPDADMRRQRLPSVFAAFAELYLTHDETYLAGECVGAALWAPAGSEPVPEEHAESFGAQLAAALGEAAERALELDERLEEHHPDQDCAYLQFMGVVPEHQGRGLGSRLLTAVLDGCDASGTPAYLEATSPDNRRLYQRHGFEVVGELALPMGPSLWRMWREPRQGLPEEGD